MSNLDKKLEFEETVCHVLGTHFLEIQRPVLFAIVLIYSMMLAVYTWSISKRRHNTMEIKQMQFGIRRILKKEQQTFDLVKRIMRASMNNIDHGTDRWNAELEKLRRIVLTITSDMKKLECKLCGF